jgi:prepilin-type N-terminal cleavage/methylation domain-containing protein
MSALAAAKQSLPGIRRSARQHGLTIVELVVTLAIAAVLVGIGAPSFLGTINSYRVMTEASAIVGDLQYARSVAIQQGADVQMCMSTNLATCSTSATSWKTGYIVLDSFSNVLRKQAAFSGTDTMTSSDTTIQTIVFNREGFAGASAASWNSFSYLNSNLHVKIQPANSPNSGMCVVVSKAGQLAQVPVGANDNFNTAC